MKSVVGVWEVCGVLHPFESGSTFGVVHHAGAYVPAPCESRGRAAHDTQVCHIEATTMRFCKTCSYAIYYYYIFHIHSFKKIYVSYSIRSYK